MPYALLEERSRREGRDSVRETVCTLLGYGYSLEPLDQDRGSRGRSRTQSSKDTGLSPDETD